MRRITRSVLLLLLGLSSGCKSGSSTLDAAARRDLIPTGADARTFCKPDRDPTCSGALLPVWQLRDFQPKSARLGQVYGLEAFKGKVIVVALLSAT